MRDIQIIRKMQAWREDKRAGYVELAEIMSEIEDAIIARLSPMPGEDLDAIESQGGVA